METLTAQAVIAAHEALVGRALKVLGNKADRFYDVAMVSIGDKPDMFTLHLFDDGYEAAHHSTFHVEASWFDMTDAEVEERLERQRRDEEERRQQLLQLEHARALKDVERAERETYERLREKFEGVPSGRTLERQRKEAEVADMQVVYEQMRAAGEI